MLIGSHKQSGFTIVELLVVIVVIGILAAISIVAYSGIQQRARSASLTSDLAGASTAIKLYQVNNGVFPVGNDCSASPVAGSICLKFSSGNSSGDFQTDNSTNPATFCLGGVNSGTKYRVTNNNSPSVGTCSATSCLAILTAGESTGDGVYWIKPSGPSGFEAYCDMTTDGGGWTLIGKGRDGWNWSNAGQGSLSEIASNPKTNSVAFMPAATIDAIVNKNINSSTDGVRLYRFGPNQDWRINFSGMTTWDWNMDSAFPETIISRSPACTGNMIGNSSDTYYCAGANDCDRIFTWAWSGHNYVRGWSAGESCGCASYGLYGWCYAGEGHVLLMSQVWVRR